MIQSDEIDCDDPLLTAKPLMGDRTSQALSEATLDAEITQLRQALAQVTQEKKALEKRLETVLESTFEPTTGSPSKREVPLQPQAMAIACEQAEQFRLLIETMPIAVMIARITDSTILYANQRVSDMLGVSREALLTHKSLDFYDNPADREVLLKRLEQDEYVQDYEMCYHKADGTAGWLTISMRKVMFDDQPTVLGAFYDITERKQTARKLQEKEVFLQLVLDNIPQLIFWKDRNSTFLGCNQRWAETVELESSQAIIGKTDYDLYPNHALDPQQTQAIADYLDQDRRIFETGEPKLNFLEYKLKEDGREVWFNTNKLPIHDATGKIVGVLAMIEDVTHHKLAEREIEDARDQLQAVLDAVPGPISWVNSAGEYLGVNQNLASKYDLVPETFIGQPIGFLEGNSQFSDFMQQFINQPDPSASQVIEMAIRGSKKYYLIAAQKYQQGNAAVSVGIDMTERKQTEETLRITEENYRSIFENALEGIFQSSPEGRYINVNPSLAKIYGYASPAEMIESITNIGEQLYVDVEKRTEFRKLLEKQDTVKDFEYRCYCKDGSIIWVQIDARVVRDRAGKTLYYEGIVQDITERKQREDELRRQLEELKIEIDHKKRAKEVAMLTESSYFQEVQQEMAEINLDEFWS